MIAMPSPDLICDGCGQAASPAHTVRRLARLERATRFRPVHIRSLLLGAISPEPDSHFLYSSGEARQGEAELLLASAAISGHNKGKDAMLSEFQRAGLFLTHVLECPLEAEQNNIAGAEVLLRERLPWLFARIRRSLKPKRVVLFSGPLVPVASEIAGAAVGCPVILDQGGPFLLGNPASVLRLEQLLRNETAAATGSGPPA
jgi:hypothetical protein